MLEVITNYSPSPIIGFVFGVPIYWYGLFYVIAILLGYLFVDRTLNKIDDETSNNLREVLPQVTFWVVLWGVVGGRLYHVLNELPFYLTNPNLIWRVDLGGLAIHGALIGGLLYIIYYAQKNFSAIGSPNKSVLWLTDIITPAVLLGQAIGRWGNYFNQELYGSPTDVPWAIFISPENRVAGFETFTHFHPTFFYEFLWGLIGAIILIYITKNKLTDKIQFGTGFITSLYLVFASSGRILVELLRIDSTPDFLGARLPLLVASTLLVVGCVGLTMIFKKREV